MGKCPREVAAKENVFEKVPNFDLTLSLEKLINYKYFGSSLESLKNHLYGFLRFGFVSKFRRYFVDPFP